MATEYDVIIIGGGAAGENVAGRTSPGGLSTVIIEHELVGGECTFWACMPSKALLRPGEALAAARAVPSTASAIAGDIDVPAALRSRNAFANEWNDYWQAKWVESVNADLLRGKARLTGERSVTVELAEGGTLDLLARKAVVVAVGSHSRIPHIDGIENIDYFDNRDIVAAQEVPESIVILGAGAVALEMADAWRSLGTSSVKVIGRSALENSKKVEPFALGLLAFALERKGIEIITGRTARSVESTSTGVTVTLDNGDQHSAEQLVVAMGREANTSDLGLETIGLEPGAFIDVDDALRATAAEGGWLYAVGDVNGRALFTHQGKYQARQAGDHILGKQTSAWADNVAVPSVIFTDPQVATVGLTERAAYEKGLNVKAIELGNAVAAASLIGRGVPVASKWVVDDDRKVLVGATFVGPGAGELLHAATIAIVAETPLETLWHATPAFPTMSELWLRFLEAYGL